MASKVTAGAAQSPCRPIPPCEQGNHGFYVDAKGERTIKTIGKYYFTEDALEHDLAALKRGEVYDRDDFFKRAKAWYKAEIDRILHLESVQQQEILRTASNLVVSSPVAQESQTLATPNKDPGLVPFRTTKAQSQTPTRIQPARAAKRKTAALPQAKRPPRRKKTEPEPALAVIPAAVQQQGLQATNSSRPKTEAETRGDYTLAAFDWGQFLNGNQGEHHPSPWSYVQLQGLDVAYFCMRLERAVEEQISELLSGQGIGSELDVNKPQAPAADTASNSYSSAGAQDPIKQPSGGSKAKPKPPATHPASLPHHTPHLQTQTHPNPNPLCPLSHPSNPPPPPPRPAPFEPAAALAPGEDWRPPSTTTTTTTTTTIPITKTPVTLTPTNPVAHNAPSPAGPAGTSWAAAEVHRRQQRQQTVAPEAEMEISPTLGRWQQREQERGQERGQEREQEREQEWWRSVGLGSGFGSGPGYGSGAAVGMVPSQVVEEGDSDRFGLGADDADSDSGWGGMKAVEVSGLRFVILRRG
ncbi:hypothetical protein B0I37DRAFT_417818 [Chaetomium sp. MPI-CAGE-AT-0009]|nr:hypothetical protein B0I37DRAFT_417818 [Chaetomium sp. MPI-CAGE-AT-0009]